MPLNNYVMQKTRNILEVHIKVRLSSDHLESEEAGYLFLLCSLFKEDSDIWTEELLRYVMRLGIFSEIENFEMQEIECAFY